MAGLLHLWLCARSRRASLPLPFGVAALCLAPMLGPAQANDSVAHLAAGGLVLSRTDAIEMRSEDLFVSTREIRVRYRFFNRTDKDVTTLVAFPLPDIRAPSEEDNFVIPEPGEATNFLAFRTTVDGKPVAMQVEQRAIALDVDRTALLEKLSLPIAPHSPVLPRLLAKLPEAAQDELRELGMLKDDAFDAGQGMTRHLRPLWSARTTYHWRQTFPAKQEIVVEHRYTPSVGGSAQTFVGPDYIDSATLRDYTDRYCIDDAFVRAAKAMHGRRGQNGDAQAIVTESRLEYVLTTGTNWAGAIHAFTLTVDKGAPENLVSFCMDGVRQVSPTRYEVTKTDFWPRRNLEVLILKPQRLR